MNILPHGLENLLRHWQNKYRVDEMMNSHCIPIRVSRIPSYAALHEISFLMFSW